MRVAIVSIQKTFDPHFPFADAVSLKPMKFGVADASVSKTHQTFAFEFSPTPSAMALPE
jgi:hypothetical protein